MKKLVFAVFAALCFLTFSAFVGPWVEYKTGDKKASINFPKEPEVDAQLIQVEKSTLNMTIASFDTPESGDDNNLNYTLIYTDYPTTLVSASATKEELLALMEGSAEMIAEGVKGVITAQEANTFNTYPGQSVKISAAEGQVVFDIQLCMVNSRMYIIQVAYPTSNGGDADNIREFMESFKIK